MAHHRAKPRSAAIAGNTRSVFGPIDYLQMAGVAERSLEIVCFEHHMVRGRIWVRRGVVWDAIDGGGSGRDAFRRLMGCLEAEIAPFPEVPPSGTIREPWEPLLLDALRERDEQEAEQSSGPVSGIRAVPPASRRRATPLPERAAPATKGGGGDGVDAWLDRAVRALLAHDFDVAADAYRHVLAVRPGHALANHNLKRLARRADDEEQ